MSFDPAPISRKLVAGILLLALGLLLFPGAGFGRSAEDPINVMFLNFGSRDWPSFKALLDEYREEMERRERAPVYIYVETLDAYGNTSGPAFDDTIEEMLARKYGKQRFDVVVAVGGRPMDFLSEHRDKLFPGAKVQFTTVFHGPVPEATGVIPELDLLPTAQMALQHNPGTRRLLLISGGSPADQTGSAQLREGLQGQLRRLGSRVEVQTLPPMTYPEARRQVASLSRDTVGIFVFYFGDSAGQVVNPSSVLGEFSKLSPRPIYAVWEADVGRGSVGGHVVSLGQVGRTLAGQSSRILHGEEPSRIPVVRAGFHNNVFDWLQMRRWGIRPVQLPQGSTVLNREYTAWELYKWQILSGVALMVLEAGLILFLLYLWRVRHHAARELAHLHQLESIMAELSAALLNLQADVTNAQVDLALQRLLEVLKLDGIAVFEFSPDGQHVHLSFEKRTGEVSPAPVHIHTSELAWLMQELDQHRSVVATHLEDLPAEADQVKQFMAKLNVRSVAIFPLSSGGVTFGALACPALQRDVPLMPAALASLQALADNFGTALKRRRAEEALVESERLKSSILSSLSAQIAVVDPQGRIIASNEQWRAFAEKKDGLPVWVQEENGHFGPCNGCAPTCPPAERVLSAAREVWQGKRDSFEMEYECQPGDSERRWFLLTVTPLKGPEGGAVISHHEITEGKRSEQAIRDLSGKLITAQEEERARIARELHDDINQRMALLAIELELLGKSIPDGAGATASRLERLWKNTNEIAADIQSLSHRLHSAKLEHLGLISALRELCQDFRKQQAIAIEFRCDDALASVNMDVSLSLFRITQESLHNVAKHSQARNVRVELAGRADQLVLRVTDDGVGIAAVAHANGGLGIISMQERLRLVGGELEVRSSARGTEVEARVPLPRRQEPPAKPLEQTLVSGSSVGRKRGDEERAQQGGADGVEQVRSHS